MRLKSSPLSKRIIPTLTDWELLQAYAYCDFVLMRETEDAIEEFRGISCFFFECDELLAQESLSYIKEEYVKEYSKRRIN